MKNNKKLLSPSQLKEEMESHFRTLLKTEGGVFIPGLNNPEAYGHSAGTPLEEWVKSHMESYGWKVFFPNKFISQFFDHLGNLQKINTFLSSVWWSELLVTKKQLEDYADGREIRRWQQEGADLVIFYGSDMFNEPNSVVLINVKSHESSRKSRDPNIMSAQRLIEFFSSLIEKKDSKSLIEKMDLWFFGVGYNATENGGKITHISIKDLFKLDVAKIPQINFDAAIQIQWHVENMIETSQSKKDFMLNLANEFIKRWEKHSNAKQIKYVRLTDKIKKGLSSS